MNNDELDVKTEYIHNLISKNVAYFRKKKKLSQLELALEIGLTGNAFIARAENRTKNAHFNIEHLVKISTVLEVHICEFFKVQRD